MRLIDRILKETAEGTDGINYFNIAKEPYANAIESEFPRIWVYSTGPLDNVRPLGIVETEYNILLEVTDFIEHSATLEQISTKLDEVQRLWIKFINRLANRPELKEKIGKVAREEIVHHWSHNVVGYICAFKIVLLEIPEYQCD